MYYHLGAYEDSLTYALGAGDLFDVNGHSEYVETIIGKLCCTTSSTNKFDRIWVLSITPKFPEISIET